MSPQLASTGASVGLHAVRKILDVWNGSRSESLIDFTRQLRVEPIVLVDADCLYLDAMPDVMQSLQSIFAGYYLQAVAVMCNVGRINVGRQLERLNPQRARPGKLDSLNWMMAAESYKHKLPTYSHAVAMEAIGMAVQPNGDIEIDLDKKSKTAWDLSHGGKDTGAKFGKSVNDLTELTNLSVGKMLEVEIKDGEHSATLPIAIRLMASSLPSSSLVHILSLDTEDKSLNTRYHQWRAGRLEFFRDLVFCRDLIDARRKNLMNDKTQVYGNLMKRQQSHALAGIVSGEPSIGAASNLVVISSDTAAQLELKTNLRLSRFGDREKLFEPTSVMIMAVIDKQWERVTFYHRGIAQPTELGIRDLKASNKGSGPDVSDILKAYTLGNSPSL